MSFVFVAVLSPSPCLTHREARTVGPDVAVVARNHGVLYNFCGDELVINVALPGHGDCGVGWSDHSGNVELTAASVLCAAAAAPGRPATTQTDEQPGVT